MGLSDVEIVPGRTLPLHTEFGGFAGPPAAEAQVSAAESPERRSRNEAYGPAIIEYLEGKGIGWTVWCFDPEWGPTLIRNWNYELTPSGEFARAAMHGEIR